MKFVHCADNSNPDGNDEIGKPRPLADKLKSKFLKYFMSERQMNYGKSMIQWKSCQFFLERKM